MGFVLQISHLCFSFMLLMHSFQPITFLSHAAEARNLLDSTDNSDFQALFSIKQQIQSDPYGFLAPWNNSLHFCSWQGVGCSVPDQRVITLNLSGKGLGGILSPYLGNLTSLRDLKLENNFFYGSIPQEIGLLNQLQYISLQNNSFRGDFGSARSLFQPIDKYTHIRIRSSAIGIIGTVGYVALECGMGGRVSTLVDVYSYGILLLKMFTGKRPTDAMFRDNFNLHNYVKMAIPDQAMRISDPLLVADAKNLSISNFENCLASVFRIGVKCSADLPRERMEISDALMKLKDIRDVLNSNQSPSAIRLQ